jgi:hypothetical protein
MNSEIQLEYDTFIHAKVHSKDEVNHLKEFHERIRNFEVHHLNKDKSEKQSLKHSHQNLNLNRSTIVHDDTNGQKAIRKGVQDVNYQVCVKS